MNLLKLFLSLVLTLPFSILACGAETPTVSELQSAYKQNFKGLAPFSVEWRRINTESQAAIDEDKLGISILEKLLSSGKMPKLPKEYESQIKEQIESQKEQLKSGTSPEVNKIRLTPKTERGFFWTDGERFQYRKPNTQKDDNAPLDSVEISPETLESNYPTVSILSWSPKNKPKLRQWWGMGPDGNSPGGRVTSGGVETVVSSACFPPLGQVHKEWGSVRVFHDLDQVFHLPKTEWRQETDEKTGAVSLSAKEFPKQWHQETVASELDGEKAILLLSSSPSRSPKMIERRKVWFVPSKGFLPMKLEVSYVHDSYAPEEADKYARVYKTVKVLKVQQYGDSFYPMVLEEQNFGVDPKWKKEHPGNVPDEGILPMAVLNSCRTEFVSFAKNRKLSEKALSLHFPTGTRFVNDDDGNGEDNVNWHFEKAQEDGG